MKDMEKKDLIELLNKCWMTHDAMWFYHSVQAFGIHRTNQTNKAAIQSLAPIEVNRIKNYLGFEKEPINTFAAFKKFFAGAYELCIPEFMNARMSYPRENVMHWAFKPGECFAYKGMQRIGVIGEYECGVIHRLACWIESLGIQYDVRPKVKRCLMLDHGTCSGDFILYFEHAGERIPRPALAGLRG